VDKCRQCYERPAGTATVGAIMPARH